MITAMSLTIRPLEEADVDAADKVRRLAFGTYFGLPDPLSFSGTARLVETRRRAWPDGALVAEKDGAIVGVAMSEPLGQPRPLRPAIGASRALARRRRA
jgi:predicted N-acetyltransferase YhbS